jgi:hypothetical protein
MTRVLNSLEGFNTTWISLTYHVQYLTLCTFENAHLMRKHIQQKCIISWVILGTKQASRSFLQEIHQQRDLVDSLMKTG